MLYLDQASTAHPRPQSVSRAMASANDALVNPGRGGYPASLEASRLLYSLREAAGAAFGVADSSRIVLCGSATEGLNTVLHGCLNTGDHVLCSHLEHNAVARVLHAMGEMGVESERIPGDDVGRIDPAEFTARSRGNTAMWVLNHGSNVHGLLQDLPAIARAAENIGIPLVVDLAQSAGHRAVDLSQPGIAAAAIPGHKGLAGPMGSALLYVGTSLHPRPRRQGGTGSFSESASMPEEFPDRLEAGTPNLPGAAGLLSALGLLHERLDDEVRAMRNCRVLTDGLAEQGWETIWAEELPVFSLRSSGWDPAVLAQTLAGLEKSVAVRSGLHCAPWAHERLGTLAEGTLRLSPGATLSDEELSESLSAFAQLLRGL